MPKSSLMIGSYNGLVLSGNKPLPEPMLTKFYHAKWHKVTGSGNDMVLSDIKPLPEAMLTKLYHAKWHKLTGKGNGL